MMEKEKTPFLRSIILCFNPNFYPLVLRQSGWRSFGYLVLICAVVYGVMSYRFANVQSDFIEKDLADFYEKALPDFHFENGEADYPPDNPHVYEEREKEQVAAVIVDTSGRTTHLDEKYDAGMLITKTEIVRKVRGEEEQREAIPVTKERVLARDFFLEQGRRNRPQFVTTVTMQMTFLHTVGKTALVAIVAGVLLLADKGKASPYPFVYYFNVGCHAITPFVLSALARGWGAGEFLVYASYSGSLMLFIALAMLGLAKSRQRDARELIEGGQIEEARTG